MFFNTGASFYPVPGERPGAAQPWGRGLGGPGPPVLALRDTMAPGAVFNC